MAESLDSVAASEWDALAGEDDPFIEHAFLHAVETSGPLATRYRAAASTEGVSPRGRRSPATGSEKRG